jgi:hypothetical protein
VLELGLGSLPGSGSGVKVRVRARARARAGKLLGLAARVSC